MSANQKSKSAIRVKSALKAGSKPVTAPRGCPACGLG